MQDILRVGLEDYLETHTLPAYQQKFVWDLLRCRTEALGGHVEVCPEGHAQRVWYNSCRHRSCPQCAFSQTQQWLEKKKQQLLACDHYHVIFTLPEELRELWRWNAEAMADLLFQTVRDTLMTLLGDEAHLGARPGILAALHTWGRTLVFHPHLHCLVTGGGLTAGGVWKPVRNGFLLPLAVVRLVYRGKFLHGLEKLLRDERLGLPSDLSLSGALQLLRQASRNKWNVRIEERYEHGRGVATYLARYLRGGPIKSSRLISYDRHSVTFRYGDHREVDASGKPRMKRMTLSMTEFLGRLLSHVPQPGQQVVRAYGLYSRTGGEALQKCREQMGPPAPVRCRPASELRWAEWGKADPRLCPVCGSQMVHREVLVRTGIPPPVLAAVRYDS